MKLYKLTNLKDETGISPVAKRTQWGENFTHETSGKGALCGPGWLHAYTDPLLAVFLNVGGANFSFYHLWEAKGDVGISDGGLKVGCKKLTTTKQMETPKVTLHARARFAILCALEVCDDQTFKTWAKDWLSGKDRTTQAATTCIHHLEILSMGTTSSIEGDREYYAYYAALRSIRTVEAVNRQGRYDTERSSYSTAADAASASKEPINFAAIAKMAVEKLVL